MGWYMDPNFNWDEHEGAAPACSLSNKPNSKSADNACTDVDAGAGAAPSCSSNKSQSSEQPKSKPQRSSSPSSKTTAEESTVSSGNTPCLLPTNSPPPPPPPDSDSIYHLCLYENWKAACDKQEPYFPPTFMADGKFTRATLHKADVVDAANEYYQDRPGEWVCLELNCQYLFQLGIPILAQDAPESSPDKPVKCLQIFGGISTTQSSPALVRNIFKMRRSPEGRFLRVSSSTIGGVGGGVEVKDLSKQMKETKLEQAPKETKKKSKGLFGRLRG